jgi:hypothetical protein
MKGAATGANVARRGVDFTKVHRYFQAQRRDGGYANRSRARFEFVADVKNCPVGRVGYPGRRWWPARMA